MANYSFKDPGDAIEDGSIIDAGNFTQHTPDTPIMAGKPLTITGGNFTNVRQDPNWIVKGGNFSQVSRCSHLHPGEIAHGLAVCAVDCIHSTTYELEIDGVVVETIYYYEDAMS